MKLTDDELGAIRRGVSRSQARQVIHRLLDHIADSMPPTDAQIKHMVDRFLTWRLPDNFSPDCGISVTRTFNDHLPQPSKYEPVGTNLFSATQADAMVRYMLDGLPRA